MTNEPREQKMYTREELLAIADAWGGLNYWYGKLRGYSDAGYEPDEQDFHLDKGGLTEMLRKIPYDVSCELEKEGYSEEIIKEL